MLNNKQLLISVAIIALISCNTTIEKHGRILSTNKLEKTLPIEPKLIEKVVDKKIPVKEVFSAGKYIKHIKSLKVTTSEIISQTPTSLSADFKTISQGFQEFTVNSGFDTTIICKEGTTIKIAPLSFLIESTQAEVKEKITLQVKEFYKTSEIISAGLSTHSDSSILETGGMLFIQAVLDGQLCRLKESTSIEIAFPFAERKDSMLLFSGNRENGKINWVKPVSQKEPPPQQAVDETAVYPGEESGIYNFINKNLSYPGSLAEAGIGGRVEFDFVIDEIGVAKDFNIRISSHPAFTDAVLKALRKMGRWKPAKKNGIAVKSTFTQTVTFINPATLADTIFQKNFETVTNDSNLSKVSVADIRYYIFSASKLGWMNCDRFYETKKARTDLYIDCGDFTNLDVKLVFHNFKSVLADFDKGSEFKNIPVDEPVTVVVVKKINDKIFASLIECNTSQARINNLQFEEVTMERLKQKLERLNVLIN